MYEYINEALARETAYDEGYEAGKQAAAEDILEEITKLSKEGGVIWTNYARACVEILKKKYGVN
jgi:hypothetical protein